MKPIEDVEGKILKLVDTLNKLDRFERSRQLLVIFTFDNVFDNAHTVIDIVLITHPNSGH